MSANCLADLSFLPLLSYKSNKAPLGSEATVKFEAIVGNPFAVDACAIWKLIREADVVDSTTVNRVCPD